MKTPTIVDVVFISAGRAAIKAECGDHIGYRLTTYEEGERVLRELLEERSGLPAE